MRFKDYLKNNNLNLSDQDFDFDVSNLVTTARLKAGLTQEALAKLMGTKQPSVARIENGKSLPTISFLKKVAKAVGMHLIPPRLEEPVTRKISTNSSVDSTSYVKNIGIKSPFVNIVATNRFGSSVKFKGY